MKAEPTCGKPIPCAAGLLSVSIHMLFDISPCSDVCIWVFALYVLHSKDVSPDDAGHGPRWQLGFGAAKLVSDERVLSLSLGMSANEGP